MPQLCFHTRSSQCCGNKPPITIDLYPASISKLGWLQKGKSFLPTFLSLLPEFLDLLVGHSVLLGPLKGYPTTGGCKGTGGRWSSLTFMTGLKAGKGSRCWMCMPKTKGGSLCKTKQTLGDPSRGPIPCKGKMVTHQGIVLAWNFFLPEVWG